MTYVSKCKLCGTPARYENLCVRCAYTIARKASDEWPTKKIKDIIRADLMLEDEIEEEPEKKLVTGEGIKFSSAIPHGLIFGKDKFQLWWHKAQQHYIVSWACARTIKNLPLQPIKFGEWEVGDWVYSLGFADPKFDSVEHYLLIVDNFAAIRLRQVETKSISMMLPILVPLNVNSRRNKNYWKVIF